MADIVKQIANLLSVKSIITIILTVVFGYLSMTQQLSQEFLTIYTVIISFYFGTQFEKKNTLVSKAESITESEPIITDDIIVKENSVNNDSVVSQTI